MTDSRSDNHATSGEEAMQKLEESAQSLTSRRKALKEFVRASSKGILAAAGLGL